jgi:hypothetical protein
MSEVMIHRLLRAPVYIARHAIGADDILARPAGRRSPLITERRKRRWPRSAVQ